MTLSIRRVAFRITLAAVAVAAAGAGVWHLAQPKPLEVLVRTVEKGRVEDTVANTRAGSVRACRRAKLAPSTGGQVSALPVREGSEVSKGDILLELWNADLAAEVTLARSQVAAAKARAEEACVLRDQAVREENRLKTLYADGLASIERLEQAQSNAEVTQASCKAALASLEQSEARVTVAEAALARTTLRAPFDGVVAELNAELGEYVTPSPPGIPTLPAVDLIEAGCLYIVAPIDEVDAPRVKVGLNVRVRLDSFPQRRFEGRVRRIAPFVLEREKQARTVDVEVELVNGEDRAVMLPGYSADVEVLLAAREDVLRVPTEAITGGRSVLVLENGVLVERAVEIGLSNWELTEVRAGLQEGERVVVSLGREGVAAGVLAEAETETSQE